MVIDTSVIIAILSYEAEAEAFTEAIQDDPTRLISAATLLESAIVTEARYGEAGGDKLDELVKVAQIRVEPVTVGQVAVARQAYRTYGKGRYPAVSTSAIASLMHWRKFQENLSCLRGKTLARRISGQSKRHDISK